MRRVVRIAGWQVAALYSVLSLAAAPSASETTAPDQPRVQTSATPEPTAVPDRRLVLGRIVNLQLLRAEHTVTDVPPDRELADPPLDFGALLLRDGTIQAVRLSTGDRLWMETPHAPCTMFGAGGPHVYAVCGGKLLSFAKADGASQVVDAGPVVVEVVVAGSLVASRHQDGRVAVFDTATNKRVASKTLPELVGAVSAESRLVASPTVAGVCVVGLKVGSTVPHGWAYAAGCYTAQLASRWRRRLSPDVAATQRYYLRQEGPYSLVLNDQSPPWERASPAGSGTHGIVLRWRDGAITPFDDGTFATIEDRGGERITSPAVLDIFTRTVDLQVDHEPFAFREATVASDGQRTFALVRNGSTGLAAVDLTTARVLFLVPVPLGGADWTLEVAAGRPIVRTRFRDQWRASIQDPDSGRVLYHDERPLGR